MGDNIFLGDFFEGHKGMYNAYFILFGAQTNRNVHENKFVE